MGSIFALLRELFFMLGYVKTASGFPKPLGADEERSAIEALSRGDEQARRTLIAGTASAGCSTMRRRWCTSAAPAPVPSCAPA